MEKLLKFETIYEDIKRQILSNAFDESDKLPAENVLVYTYNCSRPTLQKALRKLISEKLVYTIQGSGTYINKDYIQQDLKLSNIEKQKQSLYGLILPNLGEGYIFKPITDNIAQIISYMNSSLIWGGYISPYADNFEQQIVNICTNYIQLGLKGVFFSPFEYNDQSKEVNTYIVKTLSQANIPIVLIDSDITNFPQKSNYDTVSIDHFQAGYMITAHILNKGLKKILFLSLPYSKNTFKLRTMGFNEALLDHGIIPDKDWHVILDPKDVQAVSEMIEKYNPEGIIGFIDRAAIDLINTLKKIGISVPQDILIGGFDDLGFLFNMPITSIRQPLEEISKIAVKMMYDRVNDPSIPIKKIFLNGELISRVSTDRTSDSSL